MEKVSAATVSGSMRRFRHPGVLSLPAIRWELFGKLNHSGGFFIDCLGLLGRRHPCL